MHRLFKPMAKPLDSLHLVGTLHHAISARAVPLASLSSGARITLWLWVNSAQDRVRDLALHSYAEYEETATKAAALVNGKSRMLHLQHPGD